MQAIITITDRVASFLRKYGKIDRIKAFTLYQIYQANLRNIYNLSIEAFSLMLS